MPVVYKKDGQIIWKELGNPEDPRAHATKLHLPEDCEFEVITRKEMWALLPETPGITQPDSPEVEIQKLKKEHNALIDVIEEELKLPKGHLREKIRMKGG